MKRFIILQVALTLTLITQSISQYAPFKMSTAANSDCLTCLKQNEQLYDMYPNGPLYITFCQLSELSKCCLAYSNGTFVDSSDVIYKLGKCSNQGIKVTNHTYAKQYDYCTNTQTYNTDICGKQQIILNNTYAGKAIQLSY